MSHVESVDTVIVDLQAMEKACERLGVQFIQGKKDYNWFGMSVGDYPLPEGMTKEELGKCEHAIRVNGVNYEVGLVKNKTGPGFKFAYDFYGSGGRHDGMLLKEKFGDKLSKLVDAYSLEALKIKARAQGYLCSEKTLANGKIELIATHA